MLLHVDTSHKLLEVVVIFFISYDIADIYVENQKCDH